MVHHLVDGLRGLVHRHRPESCRVFGQRVIDQPQCLGVFDEIGVPHDRARQPSADRALGEQSRYAGQAVPQRHGQIHLPRRHTVANALCGTNFGGHCIPIIARPLRPIGRTTSTATHQLGNGRQPAGRGSRLHPRAVGDRGHYGGVVSVRQLLSSREHLIEHSFDSSCTRLRGQSPKTWLWTNFQLWITRSSQGDIAIYLRPRASNSNVPIQPPDAIKLS
jgi:hypothetical protein